MKYGSLFSGYGGLDLAVESCTAPQLPLGDTTGEDLACAVQVLAAEADRARRLVGLWRGESHRLWAERADRLERALVAVQLLETYQKDSP